MKRLLILFCVISAVCLAQTVPLTVGVTAPDPGTCNKITSGSLYVRSGDPTNAPIGVYRCSQVGPVQVIWQPIDHLVLATLPTTCTVGDIGYQTSGTTGLYACTAANTWGALGGLSAVTVQSNGTVVGSRGTINIVPGSGIVPTVSDTGTKINIQSALDTTVAETRLNEAAGGDLLVTPASGSGTAYVGCPVGVTPPLTTGMVVHLVPDVSSTGGATTFSYCSGGVKSLVEADGSTNLTSTDLVAGRQQDIWYDGSLWRLKVPTSSGGGGSAFPSVLGINAKASPYNAKGDGKILTDVSMGAGNNMFTCSTDCYASAYVWEFSGVNTTAPINVYGTAVGTGTTATAPSVTTTVANTRLLTLIGGNATSTITAPVGPTQRVLIQPSSWIGLYAGDLLQAAIGATSAYAATLSQSQLWSAMSIALVPNGTVSFVGGTSWYRQEYGQNTAIFIPPPGGPGNVQIACINYALATISGVPTGYTLIGTAGTLGVLQTSCYWRAVTTNSSNTVTSASATFSASDVGKLIGVGKTAGYLVNPLGGPALDGTDSYGTIVSYIDPHNVSVSFSNAGGGAHADTGNGTHTDTAITANEAWYASDDTAALQAALAAACGTELDIPGGLYGIKSQLTPCNTGSLSIVGAGGGWIDYYGYASLQLGNPIGGTGLLYLTKSLVGDGILWGNGITGTPFNSADAAYQLGRYMRNISLLTGVGGNNDGGSSTSDGIGLTIAGNLYLENVFVSGFGEYCLNLQGPIIAVVEKSKFQQCLWGGNVASDVAGQNVRFDSNDFSNNQGHGLVLQGGTSAILTNNILQWNGRASGTWYEFAVSDPGISGIFQGNWVEDRNAGAGSASQILPTYLAGWNISNNHFQTAAFHSTYASAGTAYLGGSPWFCSDCQWTTPGSNPAITSGSSKGCYVGGVVITGSAAWVCISQ
jgi:hypothetical protein